MNKMREFREFTGFFLIGVSLGCVLFSTHISLGLFPLIVGAVLAGWDK